MERSSAIVAGDNPAAPPGMEPAGGNQAAPPWRADRRQSCTTSRPWPKPKGTGTTDAAALPKQTGKKAKEKKDTNKTAKTVQKKPAGKTVAAKKAKVQKKTAGKTAPTKDVDVTNDLAKFPGTSYRKALQFPPCTVYYDIPKRGWRIKSKHGSRRTELVKFTSDGSHSKAQWQDVVKKVKAYQQ